MTVYTVPVPQTKFTQEVRNRIGEAIYLLGYLIQQVNWETGTAYLSREQIAADTGYPIRTISRWLEILSAAGEIDVRRTRYAISVRIIDYKAVAHTRGITTEPDTKPDVEPETRSAKHGISDVPNVALLESSEVPNAALRCAKSGILEVPKMAGRCAKSGTSGKRYISVQNLYKTRVQNSSKTGTADEVVEPITGREIGKENELTRFRCSPCLEEERSSSEILRQNENKTIELTEMPASSGQNENEIAGSLDCETAGSEESETVGLREAQEMVATLEAEKYEELFNRAMEKLETDPVPFHRMFVRRNSRGELEPNPRFGKMMIVRKMAEMLIRRE